MRLNRVADFDDDDEQLGSIQPKSSPRELVMICENCVQIGLYMGGRLVSVFYWCRLESRKPTVGWQLAEPEAARERQWERIELADGRETSRRLSPTSRVVVVVSKGNVDDEEQ